MRILDFAVRRSNGLARLTANLVWEESDRSPFTVFYETDERFFEDGDPDPTAVLVGVVHQAMCTGEKRILVEGSVCPALRDGLLAAMFQLSRWYGFRPLDLEAAGGWEVGWPRAVPRVASFLSGGIDAMATLRWNRLHFSIDHPASIRDALFVRGLEGQANADLMRRSLQSFAAATQLVLIPVATNVTLVDPRQPYLAKIYGAAFLSSVAHFLSCRLTTAMIASTYQILEMEPWGSHPMLDPNYGSSRLSIRHDGARLFRHEKVALVAEWDEALSALRSCWNPFVSADRLNCGECEKCLRTMTELLIHGMLGRCKTFPYDDVTPERLTALSTTPLPHDELRQSDWMRRAVMVLGEGASVYWRPLVTPLRRIGRMDLADVIETKLHELEKNLARKRRQILRARLSKTLFSKLRERFQPALRKVKRAARRLRPAPGARIDPPSAASANPG